MAIREVYGVAFQIEGMDEPRLQNLGRNTPYYGTTKEVAESVAGRRSDCWVVRLEPVDIRSEETP